MTDFPALMSAPMVVALLDGSKTQTRQKAWRPSSPTRLPNNARTIQLSDDGCVGARYEAPTIWQKVKPGDRIWVRETFGIVTERHREMSQRWPLGMALFRADHGVTVGGVVPDTMKWRPSIHMPRWASRLTLTVTEVERENVQSITYNCAKDEGVSYERGYQDPREAFANLWNRLHGDGAWQANPEVVAITFTTKLSNIDKEA